MTDHSAGVLAAAIAALWVPAGVAALIYRWPAVLAYLEASL